MEEDDVGDLVSDFQDFSSSLNSLVLQRFDNLSDEEDDTIDFVQTHSRFMEEFEFAPAEDEPGFAAQPMSVPVSAIPDAVEPSGFVPGPNEVAPAVPQLNETVCFMIASFAVD